MFHLICGLIRMNRWCGKECQLVGFGCRLRNSNIVIVGKSYRYGS